ncbi:MAG: SulP family inorganic anion transporter [Vicinamibacterales bacterium]
MPVAPWRPALASALRGYSRQTFVSDLVAGLTVGLVALPLAMAFAISSGVAPEAGLHTAIVGGLVVAVLGGSSIQVSGPTGAFVVVVAGIIAKFGLSGLFLVTMMGGVILIALGLSGLGTAVRYIPRPIVIGFTNGIALLIATTQIKDALGLPGTPPGEFFARMSALAEALPALNPAALGVTVASLVICLGVPRLTPRVPGAIAALVLGTAAVRLLDLPVATIGSVFGGLPRHLPTVHVPEFRADLVLPLLPSAITVALLGAVESLLSAVVADGMTGDRHDSNTELVAQGVANVLVPLVGGLPVTGAIARTATNYRAGARTPVAALVHAATLAAVVAVFAPLASSVPLATLAAVLLVVAWNMGEWPEIPSILKLEWTDIAVWLLTFVLTVVADLTVAVESGMVLAALLYVHRVSQTTTVEGVTEAYIDEGRPHVLQGKDIPPFVSILRVHGPFLFGTTTLLDEATADVEQLNAIVVLRLRNMTAIDATGVDALERLHDRVVRSGRRMLFCGARQQPAAYLARAEFVQHVGAGNILPNVDAALARARALVASGEVVPGSRVGAPNG